MNKLSKINFLISFLLLYIFAGLVTYTPDWGVYLNLFNNEYQISEYFFYAIKNIVKSMGGEYRDLHIIFTSLTSLSLIFFISKFTSKTTLVIILFIPTIFVFYTTQIRFYLAYVLMINSLYFYFVKNNKIATLSFLILSILNHYSIVFLLPYFILLRIKLNHFTKKIILYSLMIMTVFSFLMNIIQKVFNYDMYISVDSKSSIIGSLFNFLPYIISLLIINKYYKKFLLKNSKYLDKKIEFLLKMSYLPYLFLPLAFQFQIIGRRYIYGVLLFQILLAVYTNKFFNISKYRFYIYKTIPLIVLFILYIYYLPFLIWDDSNRLQNLILILLSNDMFN